MHLPIGGARTHCPYPNRRGSPRRHRRRQQRRARGRSGGLLGAGRSAAVRPTGLRQDACRIRRTELPRAHRASSVRAGPHGSRAGGCVGGVVRDRSAPQRGTLGARAHRGLYEGRGETVGDEAVAADRLVRKGGHHRSPAWSTLVWLAIQCRGAADNSGGLGA